ncbi:putative cytochrome P450 hydroxylase [Rhodococcus wratislaviensis]|uniref:Putative cytochrome P450 hydroxylase n=1 Tax=Rhodococcus wratislaviensis TaxID=44752 RepID=A0A402CF13_RHOWR|nr:cytochrome P450 [Rhodococcus wratislaviensis]GCE42164.1 putative cytochrome P450 hydroxylase [Rhodococcus wratislaviensis]
MKTATFNPLDLEYQVNPFPFYEQLREESVVWVEPLNAYFVGRYDDIYDIVRKPEIFSHRRFEELSKGEFNPVPDARSLLSSDPPGHTHMRKLAATGFKPSRLKQLEGFVAELSQSYLDGCIANGQPFDFQGDFADRIPIDMISKLLGADKTRHEDFKRWANEILSAGQRASMNVQQLARIQESVDGARDYFTALIAEKRDARGDDILSAFLDAEVDGDVLTEREILGLAILLLIGGVESTAHLIGNTMFALWKFPEQYELAKSNPDLIPNMIEESLRFDSPVQTGFLTTNIDVEIGGMVIPAESAVVAVWGAANHDPEKFPDPGKFDITRDTRGHMAFGQGPHFCLGSGLARLEAKTVFNQLFERVPNLRPAMPLEQVQQIPSYWVRGLIELTAAY